MSVILPFLRLSYILRTTLLHLSCSLPSRSTLSPAASIALPARHPLHFYQNDERTLETFRALDFPVPRNNNNNNNNNNNGDDEGIHHTKAGANRLYIERRNGGLRLLKLESARSAAIVGLSECIMGGKDRLTVFV